MDTLLDSWQRRCSASRLLRFVDINLRGIAQVMGAEIDYAYT